VKAAGNNANFLLNVGPKPDGTIQPEFVERLRQMGEWLARNGESIYGTRGGPLPPRPWGVTTQKPGKIFLHVLDWPDPVLAIPRLPARVRRASLLGSGAAVNLENISGGHLVRLPAAGRDPVDTIIVLETV